MRKTPNTGPVCYSDHSYLLVKILNNELYFDIWDLLLCEKVFSFSDVFAFIVNGRASSAEITHTDK